MLAFFIFMGPYQEGKTKLGGIYMCAMEMKQAKVQTGKGYKIYEHSDHQRLYHIELENGSGGSISRGFKWGERRAV